MQLEEKIGLESFAITRDGGHFGVCNVNSVTLLSSSDERAEKRGRERERDGTGRESEEEQKTRATEEDRPRQGLFNHDDLRDVHEFHAQCAIDMAVSHNLDTGT